MAPQGRVPLPAHRDGRETLRLRVHCLPAGPLAAANPHPVPRPAPPSDHEGGNGRGDCGNGGDYDSGITSAAVVLPDVWSDPLAVKAQSAAGSWRLASRTLVGDHVAAVPSSGASMAIELPQTVPGGSTAAVPVATTLATRTAAAGPGLCIELRPCGVLHNLTDSPLQASIARTKAPPCAVRCWACQHPSQWKFRAGAAFACVMQVVQSSMSLHEPEHHWEGMASVLTADGGSASGRTDGRGRPTVVNCV